MLDGATVARRELERVGLRDRRAPGLGFADLAAGRYATVSEA